MYHILKVNNKTWLPCLFVCFNLLFTKNSDIFISYFKNHASF